MSLSLGLYSVVLILFFVVIPGLLFRRQYYHSEFSKQLYSYPNSGHVVNIVYSFITGLVLNIVLIYLLNFFLENPIDIETILDNFDKQFIETDDKNPSISSLVNTDEVVGVNKTISKFSDIYAKLSKYIPYLLFIYLLTSFLGYILSKLIIYFNLDAIFKILRFKNSWHYLFTGRILKQSKFKDALRSNQNVEYTYLDVLVDEQSDKPKLYSGLYVDYSLNSEDPCKLEKLHLLKTHRYSQSGNATVKKEIPGTMFTILGEKILNINCIYVFRTLEEHARKKFLIRKNILVVGQIITVTLFFSLGILLFFKINILNSKSFELALNYPFFKKLGLAFLFNVTLGFLTPFDINKQEQKIVFIGFRALLYKILLFLFLFLFLYWNWFISLFS